MLVGAALGALAGLAIVGAKDLFTPGLELTAKDYVAGAAVGAAAGFLIGSGVGATAGIGLIAHSAGVGMASSAIGYTVTSGKNYKSSEMGLSAVIGGVAGAASGAVSSVLSKPLTWSQGKSIFNTSGHWYAEMMINSGINAGASIAQTVGVNMLNNRPTSQEEIGASLIFGMGMATLGDIVAPGTGLKAFLRSAAVESVNNLLIGQVPKKPIQLVQME